MGNEATGVTNVKWLEIRGNAWVGKAANGEIVARGETHDKSGNAKRAAQAVFPGVEIRPYLPKRKYKVEGIPEEEPIFVMRAKDRLALSVLDEYVLDAEGQTSKEFQRSLEALRSDFKQFAEENPNLMKYPD